MLNAAARVARAERWPTTLGRGPETTMERHIQWVRSCQIHGGYTTCTAMSWNSVRIGLVSIPVERPSIRRVPRRTPLASSVAATGTTNPPGADQLSESVLSPKAVTSRSVSESCWLPTNHEAHDYSAFCEAEGPLR
jgi:hypothetical protein